MVNILAAWGRPSSSTVFKSVNSGFFKPHEKVYLDSYDNGSAVVKGFAYEVFDLNGNPLGWWPANPNISNRKLSYTLLTFDPYHFASISEENKEEISIYPNPNNGSFTLKLIGEDNIENIKIVDVQGKLISFKQVNNGNQVEVNLNQAQSGVYFIHVRLDSSKVIQSKFIKY